MALVSSGEILKLIPTLFEMDLNNDKGAINLFRKIEKMLVFDEGFIYFANPDSLQLKYSYKNHANYEKEKSFKIAQTLKSFIFSKDGKICNQEDELIDVIELKGSRQKSYIVSNSRKMTKLN